ncbi:MAG: winged helix-turn-helix domain-containing protein [Candidatus Aminicenantes bacterium]|nr:winged helix-turn-helix domain-containing protein [Candidatus Aminicenantes bacterium]
MTDGNLYGEVFTQQELNRLFEEVVLDELAIQEILLLTREHPLSVRELAEKTGLPSAAVLRRLTDMKRMGLMQVERIDKRTPLWKAVGKKEQGQ